MNKFIESMIESLKKEGYYNVKYNEYLNLLGCENDTKTIYLSNIPIDNEENIKEQGQRWLDGKDIYVLAKTKEDEEIVYTFEHFKKDMLELVKYFNLSSYSFSCFDELHTYYEGDEQKDVSKKHSFNFCGEINRDVFLVNYGDNLNYFTVYTNFDEVDEQITDCQCIEQVKETIKEQLSKKEKEQDDLAEQLDELIKCLVKFVSDSDE